MGYLSNLFKNTPPGAILSAGSGIITGLLNGYQQKKNAKRQDYYNSLSQQRQYDYQTQLNQQAQEYNVQNMALENQYAMDNWLMQQDYNSPENQLKRVKEAGLNPNMVLGQGNITNATSNAPDTPSAQSPSAGSAGSFQTDVANIESPLSTAYKNALNGFQASLQYNSVAQDLRNKRAQEAYTYADTRRTLEDIKLKQQERYNKSLQVYEQEFKNSKLSEQYEIQLKKDKAAIEQTEATIRNLDSNSALAKSNLDVSIETANESRKRQKKLEAEEKLISVQTEMQDELLAYYRRNGWTPDENIIQRVMSLGSRALSSIVKGEIPDNLPEPVKVAARGVINKRVLIQNGFRPGMY